jgi:hypothetical protein
VTDYLRIFILPLALTIVVEVGVALFFGLRHKLEIAAICLINVTTNPLMNFLLLLNYYFNYIFQPTVLLLVLEVIVVLVEWRLLTGVLMRNSKIMLALSISMNTCSCLAGLLILR